MSYSTWICVDKFSDPRIDPHGIRLLTPVVRNVTDRPAEGGGGQDLVCLSVVLSPKDKTLLVRTKETPLPKGNTFVRLLPVSLYLIVRLGSNDWEPTRSQHPATRLLHNAAGHLSEAASIARTLGVRVFCPRPVCTTILSVGRPSRRWNGRDPSPTQKNLEQSQPSFPRASINCKWPVCTSLAARLSTGSLRNSSESLDSTGSSSFYSIKSSSVILAASSFPCPTCWPDSAKASQRPAQTDGPDPRTSSS